MEIGILQFGSVEAGSAQIRSGKVGFAQIAEVEGGSTQIAVGIVSADQNLFGHIHGGVDAANRQEQERKDQHGGGQNRQASMAHHSLTTVVEP